MWLLEQRTVHPLTKVRFRKTSHDGSVFETEIEVHNGSIRIDPVVGLQVTPTVPVVQQAGSTSLNWRQWVLEAFKWLRMLGGLMLL
jgi:hypothetical protein